MTVSIRDLGAGPTANTVSEPYGLVLVKFPMLSASTYRRNLRPPRITYYVRGQ